MPVQRSLRRALAPALVTLSVVASLLGVFPAQAATATSGWSDVDRATTDPTSYVTMIGDYDEAISQGMQRLWTADQTIEVGGSAADRVVVRVGGDRVDSYTFIFSAPTGETLTNGDYSVATGRQAPVDGGARLELSGHGLGCNQGDGAFTVKDIAPDLSRLWLTYEFACEDAVGMVRGEIRIDTPPEEPLTLAADDLHWKTSPPGRDYGTQRVFAINNSDEPIALGPTEVTGAAFSLVGNSCDEILPGDSCAVDVAFDPLTRGTEEGLLRVTTSVADTPVVKVPLTGVGNAGSTYFYSRTVTADGRTFDTAMTSDVAMFRADHVDPRRVSIGVPDPNSLDDPPNGRVSYDHVTFQAAAGDNLEAGRTYTGSCDGENGVLLDLPRACGGSTGSFILDEFELRPDGTLARFRARATMNGVEDPSYVTRATVAWQADEDATPYSPFIKLSGPSRVPEFIRSSFTATITAGHGITSVDLYATTPQGRTLVDSVRVEYYESRVDLRAYPVEDTVLVAEAKTADGVVVRSKPLAVAVDSLIDPGARAPKRKVSLTLRGARQHGASGRAASGRSVAVLRLRPKEADRCLKLQVQRRVHGRWVPRSLSNCRRTDGRGTATAAIVTKPGITLRARAVWYGDRRGMRVASPWRTLRERR